MADTIAVEATVVVSCEGLGEWSEFKMARRVVVILGDDVVLMYIGNCSIDSFVAILYDGRLGIIIGDAVVVMAVLFMVEATVVVFGVVEVVLIVVVANEAIVDVVSVASSKSLSAMTITGGLKVLLPSNCDSSTAVDILSGSWVGIVHKGNVEQSRRTVITTNMTNSRDSRVMLNQIISVFGSPVC